MNRSFLFYVFQGRLERFHHTKLHMDTARVFRQVCAAQVGVSGRECVCQIERERKYIEHGKNKNEISRAQDQHLYVRVRNRSEVGEGEKRFCGKKFRNEVQEGNPKE